MRQPRLLATSALLLVAVVAQVAMAEDCSGASEQASAASCFSGLFTPRPCPDVAAQATPALAGYIASVMAAMAYDSPSDGMTWEDAVRERLGKWATQFKLIIQADNGLDTQAVVAATPATEASSGIVFVIFRGSSEAVDWKTNLQTEFVTVPGLGRLHSGFHSAYSIVSAELASTIDSLRQAGGSTKQVVFAGHSLGGALATIAAAYQEMREAGSVAGVYTFGSPRVGDSTWAQAYAALNSLNSYTVRYVAGLDPVPLLPPGGYFGFVHVGYEVALADGQCLQEQHLPYCSSTAVPSTAGNFDGLLGWVADQACSGSSWLADAITGVGAWWMDYDLEYSASDLVSAEPEICCSNINDHGIARYTDLIRASCLDACDWLVHCVCTPPSDSDLSTTADSIPDTASYKFIVKTSCEYLAGTDANIMVKITDAAGGWFQTGYLDNSGDDLETCNADEYTTGTLEWYVDLLTVQEAQIFFEPTAWFGPSWLPEFIQVYQNPGTDRETGRQFCNGNGWLESTGWYSFYQC